MKTLLCINSSYAALSGLERGRVVSVHEEGYVLCDHKRYYYDAIKVSDELMAEIEPELQAGRTVIYEHDKGKVRICSK